MWRPKKRYIKQFIYFLILIKGRHTKQAWSCLRIYGWRLLRLFLLLLIICFLPLAWILISMWIPLELWTSRSRKRRHPYSRYYRRRKTGCCCGLFLFFLGIILLPVTMPGTLCYGLFLGYKKLKRIIV